MNAYMKDNFSNIAEIYSAFRPEFPPEFIDALCNLSLSKNLVWDCGTGNGQVAKYLAKHFDKVIATDISINQIDKAVRLSNIDYRVESAENASLENKSVDLIVVAQAVHWFDFEKFYREANRFLTGNGIIAVIGYPLFKTDIPELNELIQNFYSNIIGKYWDAERRYIDEKYETIPFPFDEFNMPRFDMKYSWNYDQLVGYLSSWTAVAHYIKEIGKNPLELINEKLKELLPENVMVNINFEIIGRYGFVFEDLIYI